MLKKRTNILFDEAMWSHLTYRAKKSRTSVGDLIRKAVYSTYIEDDSQTKIASTIEKIKSVRPHFKKVNYKQLIRDGQK